MMKRKKEGGFTLIELMIVIAVIGILAIVLIPRVGSIKTQAKGAGIDTNVRLVQGYIQSKASKWADQSATQDEVSDDIYNAFNNPTNNDEKMKNPYSAATTIYDGIGTTTQGTQSPNNALQILSAPPTSGNEPDGSVVVVIPATIIGTSSYNIYAYDNTGTQVSSVTVTP